MNALITMNGTKIDYELSISLPLLGKKKYDCFTLKGKQTTSSTLLSGLRTKRQLGCDESDLLALLSHLAGVT